MKLPRAPWDGFSDVLIHAAEPTVKQHPAYLAAKSGDDLAARALVRDTINPGQVQALAELLTGRIPILVSAHAFEQQGVNAIPEALANELGRRLGWEVDSQVVQSNIVAYTGAQGFSRLARQARFDGPILPGADYVLVDDLAAWEAPWPTCADTYYGVVVK